MHTVVVHSCQTRMLLDNAQHVDCLAYLRSAHGSADWLFCLSVAHWSAQQCKCNANGINNGFGESPLTALCEVVPFVGSQ
jgi:hypothetical protein